MKTAVSAEIAGLGIAGSAPHIASGTAAGVTCRSNACAHIGGRARAWPRSIQGTAWKSTALHHSPQWRQATCRDLWLLAGSWRCSQLGELPKHLWGQSGTRFRISDVSVQMGMNKKHEPLSCTRGHHSKAAPSARSWVWSEPSLLSWYPAWYIGGPSLTMEKSLKFAGILLFLHAQNPCAKGKNPTVITSSHYFLNSVRQLATASTVGGARNPLRWRSSLAFLPRERT